MGETQLTKTNCVVFRSSVDLAFLKQHQSCQKDEASNPNHGVLGDPPREYKDYWYQIGYLSKSIVAQLKSQSRKFKDGENNFIDV